MTHPFHPWFGRVFVFLAVRQTWSQDRVFFLDSQGRQFSLPAGWTDAVDVDPFVAMAAGRCPFRFTDLVELRGLIGGLTDV
ncbi:MAG TPA: DUF5372 family protein [Mycobacterium sp.]|nr:DUF5372 family protein [Mycobacterium sp.]HUH67592.1 DUF5372 family protein [Mycobacterium sp.]